MRSEPILLLRVRTATAPLGTPLGTVGILCGSIFVISGHLEQPAPVCRRLTPISAEALGRMEIRISTTNRANHSNRFQYWGFCTYLYNFLLLFSTLAVLVFCQQTRNYCFFCISLWKLTKKCSEIEGEWSTFWENHNFWGKFIIFIRPLSLLGWCLYTLSNPPLNIGIGKPPLPFFGNARISNAHGHTTFPFIECQQYR